jgi:hypothetical protein
MKIANYILAFAALAMVTTFTTGCGESKSATRDTSETKPAEKVNASDFVLTSEPGGAVSVAATRENAKNEEKIVVVGRIGGTTHPWVDGAAAFTIVDEAMEACGDATECLCPTPWDYCCVSPDTLAVNSVTIKFADADNRARRFSPKEVFGLTELQTIVVEGIVDRDDTGKFTILADKLFIKK